MVDSGSGSLAQNPDGPQWPIKGKDETPAAYINLTLEEAVELLAHKRQPESRVDDLADILRETLAFDNPFGEMVEQSAAREEQDNSLRKNLAKLRIPEGFPITLAALALARVSREFCALEKLGTLGKFAVFSPRHVAPRDRGWSDFKTLLNALSHVDAAAVGRGLPYRPEVPGLNLIETVPQLVHGLEPAERARVAAGGDAIPTALTVRVKAAATYFPAQGAQLKQAIERGAKWSRELARLGDPALEAFVATLRAKALDVVGEKPKRGSCFSRWFGKSAAWPNRLRRSRLKSEG